MKHSITNVVIIGFVLGILYLLVGHSYVTFFISGKSQILEVANRINDLCNSNRECPAEMEGWIPLNDGRGGLIKDSMVYIPLPAKVSKDPSAFANDKLHQPGAGQPDNRQDDSTENTRSDVTGTSQVDQYLNFVLIYRVFAPDQWFEAEGGVKRTVTSGWKSR